MIFRATIILAPVLLLAVATFSFIVREEIQRVVSVHITDKASHLMDMVLADGQNLDQLRRAIQAPEFLDMARASGVATIDLHGADGALLTMGAPHDHSGHGHDHTGTLSGQPPQPPRVQAGHGHHVHAADAVALEALSGVPPPAPDQLRGLLRGDTGTVVSIATLTQEQGASLPYGQVSLSAPGPDGRLIGIVTFTMSTAGIHGAVSQSTTLYGIALTIFGGLLFIIPATGFWLQRRLAERTARDVGFLSHHDALTGLLNRQTFSSTVDEPQMRGKITQIGYVDADRFKLINDTYGHGVGDAYLRLLANALREQLGDAALIARFGGDEFTFALVEVDESDANRRVESLRRQAGREHSIDGFSISSSISVGIAAFHAQAGLEENLRRADTALYFAKANGRDQVAVYDSEMGRALQKRRATEDLMRKAIATDGFTLAFQPLVNAKSETVLGYEALLRLKDPQGNDVPPSEFIPIAEEIGLIEEIGTWVLFNAMDQISAFDDVSGVSINLSAEQFRSGKLVGNVKAALQASGLAPQRLELEITESVLLQHESEVEFQVDALKAMGISIAMDDFGTGFSSLSTLWRYGFDRIKIDKSFIQALEEAPDRSRQLIDSIILLGARMNMSITAEGIETDHQKALLAELGCDVLQGFRFGRPAELPLPSASREPRTGT